MKVEIYAHSNFDTPPALIEVWELDPPSNKAILCYCKNEQPLYKKFGNITAESDGQTYLDRLIHVVLTSTFLESKVII